MTCARMIASSGLLYVESEAAKTFTGRCTVSVITCAGPRSPGWMTGARVRSSGLKRGTGTCVSVR